MLRSRNKKPSTSWHISNEMLDETLDAILKRITINHEFDIPYLAGYSQDGKTIYIDRHAPESFVDSKGKKIDVARYWVLHEAVEKTLIDKLGLHYLHAHQIALRVEEDAVNADKVSWDEYNDFCQKIISKIEVESVKKTPKDLDLTPYKDEKDYKLLKQMEKTMVSEELVPLIKSINRNLQSNK